jgi:hypothetical protein
MKRFSIGGSKKMARPEKDAKRKVNRGPVQGWLEVENVPFRGRRPSLPKRPIGQGALQLLKLIEDAEEREKARRELEQYPRETRAWWHRITRLPHCVLWDDGDWQFALDTARIHAAIVEGDIRLSTELRAREKQMGTTLKARELLKIRYVEPEESVSPETPAMEPDEEERWRRLIDEDGGQ